MVFVDPITLSGFGVKLVPLAIEHESGLRAAAEDGELWKLRVTLVPAPHETRGYIEAALKSREAGTRLAFAVVEEPSGTVVGCTSYHDIVPAPKRVEIGYTWYAERVQRTHVNTACKFRLLTHAFDTLACNVVG